MTAPADAYLFNLLRMLFCIPIGAVLVLPLGVTQLSIDGGMLLICLFSGAANVALLVGWILAIQKNTMVAVDVGLMLGSILPALLCFFCFNEPISLSKMLGFLLILAASAVLAGRSHGRAKSDASGLIFLFLAGVGDGLAGFAQQLYKQYYTEAGTLVAGVVYPKAVFHFYTYVFASALLLLCLLFLCLKNALAAGKRPDLSIFTRCRHYQRCTLIYIAAMAVCMFAANYFQTVSTNDYAISSQVLYPIMKGGCLITVNFTAMLFFGERITPRSSVGSLLALSGIVCMSVL